MASVLRVFVKITWDKNEKHIKYCLAQSKSSIKIPIIITCTFKL